MVNVDMADIALCIIAVTAIICYTIFRIKTRDKGE